MLPGRTISSMIDITVFTVLLGIIVENPVDDCVGYQQHTNTRLVESDHGHGWTLHDDLV